MGVLSYTVVLERVSASFVVDGNTGATLFEFCCAQYVFASVFPVFFSSSCLLLFSRWHSGSWDLAHFWHGS